MRLFSGNSLILQRFCSRFITASIRDVFQQHKTGDSVRVQGWIKSVRKQKTHIFLDLNDGSSADKLQILCPENTCLEMPKYGSSIVAEGVLGKSPKGQLELAVSQWKVLGNCNIAEGFPFAARKSYPLDYVRQYPQFRSRTNFFQKVFRVRNAASLAIHNYFNAENFVLTHTPILTQNDCEGAGEVFRVIPENQKLVDQMKSETFDENEAFFNGKAFLTVSGQLHLEAMSHGLGKVYNFGPTFRAENARSRLHLSEFYMVEAEIAFVEELAVLTNFLEHFLKKITKETLKKCKSEDLKPPHWLHKAFPIITFEEASKIIQENKKFKETFKPNFGLNKEHELFLVKYFEDCPVFVVDWPKEMKPFYMRENADNSTVAALDLLAPIVGELAGGSLRENSFEKLKEKLPGNHLKWYLDLRKFGGVPTGGFGLGFERYLQVLLNIENIKDAISFPRWPHNCSM